MVSSPIDARADAPAADLRRLVRIGELARTTGVPAATLRAWQRRYGVLEPTRTPAGYRLYAEDDAQRVRDMQRLIQEGVATAEAAAAVRAAQAVDDGPAPLASASLPAADLAPADAVQRMRAAVHLFDGAGVHLELDGLLAAFSTSTVLSEALLPLLRGVGEDVVSGAADVAHEHFASNLLRGRLQGLARAWDAGAGTRAVLACAPGDAHDLGLLMFGLALRECGWRITFLGADTPVASARTAADAVDASAVVVSRTVAGPLGRSVTAELRELGARRPLAIGGAGTTPRLARALGARLLEPDPVAAARSEVLAHA